MIFKTKYEFLIVVTTEYDLIFVVKMVLIELRIMSDAVSTACRQAVCRHTTVISGIWVEGKGDCGVGGGGTEQSRML